MGKCTNFILYHVFVQFSEHYFYKECLSLLYIINLLWHRSIDHMCLGLFLGPLLSSMNTCICLCVYVCVCVCTLMHAHQYHAVMNNIKEHDTSSFVLFFFFSWFNWLLRTFYFSIKSLGLYVLVV